MKQNYDKYERNDIKLIIFIINCMYIIRFHTYYICTVTYIYLNHNRHNVTYNKMNH